MDLSLILKTQYLLSRLLPNIITLNVALSRLYGADLNSFCTLELCGELLKMLMTRPYPRFITLESVVGPGFDNPKTPTGDSDGEPGLRATEVT